MSENFQLRDRVNVIGHGPGEVTGRSYSEPSRYDVQLLDSNLMIHNLLPVQIEVFVKEATVTCPSCGGDGHWGPEECPACQGDGTVPPDAAHYEVQANGN